MLSPADDEADVRQGHAVERGNGKAGNSFRELPVIGTKSEQVVRWPEAMDRASSTSVREPSNVTTPVAVTVPSPSVVDIEFGDVEEASGQRRDDALELVESRPARMRLAERRPEPTRGTQQQAASGCASPDPPRPLDKSLSMSRIEPNDMWPAEIRARHDFSSASWISLLTFCSSRAALQTACSWPLFPPQSGKVSEAASTALLSPTSLCAGRSSASPAWAVPRSATASMLRPSRHPVRPGSTTSRNCRRQPFIRGSVFAVERNAVDVDSGGIGRPQRTNASLRRVAEHDVQA